MTDTAAGEIGPAPHPWALPHAPVAFASVRRKFPSSDMQTGAVWLSVSPDSLDPDK